MGWCTLGTGGIGCLGICFRRICHLIPDILGACGGGTGRHGPVHAGHNLEHSHRWWWSDRWIVDRDLGGWCFCASFAGATERCCSLSAKACGKVDS